MTSPVISSSDTGILREVLGTFATGVTVITTRDNKGVAHGVTANSFTSVSLDPPLVLWSQAVTSKSFPAFQESDYFAVNVLAIDQIDIANHFARSRDDKFNGIVYETGLGGVPVLAGTVSHLECSKVAAYPSGDHVVYIGRVEWLRRSKRDGLVFCGGRYMVTRVHGEFAGERQRARAEG